MNKTPHYWAVILVHERIEYGEIMKSQSEALRMMKKAMFQAAKEVIAEAIADARPTIRPALRRA